MLTGSSRGLRIVQQLVGSWTLVSWGYKWNLTVRTTGPFLRSFSSFNQPFPFAYFLRWS